MSLVKQAYEFYRKALKDGKGDMHTGHCYIAEEEEQKRIDNPADKTGKQATKISWDSCDPDCYTEWHKERQRWMRRAHNNPTLATDAMVVGLKLHDEAKIDAIIEAVGSERAKIEAAKAQAAGIPRAEL